jgi:TatA/E family protein of Tat protein translocase
MNLGFPEMLFIFLLALLIFGPRKLPEIGRQIGKAMAEFKRASNEFKAQIETEMHNLELEEAAKREPTPQILPPEGSVANTAPVSAPVDVPETPQAAKAADV